MDVMAHRKYLFIITLIGMGVVIAVLIAIQATAGLIDWFSFTIFVLEIGLGFFLWALFRYYTQKEDG